MNFIKNHWFGALIWMWTIIFALFMAVVLLSPHHDLKNRGFTFCTQKLSEDLALCERFSLCTTKTIFYNTWCDIKVIAKSFRDWYDGKNAYPWSGFLFKPATIQQSFFDDEEIKEYMQEHPDTLAEMEQLKILGKDLENVQQENVSIKNFKFELETSGVGLK